MRNIPPDELAKEWERVAPWIESALPFAGGDENLLDILVSLARGQYSLFTNENAAAVVQLLRKPRQLVLVVLYLGGASLEACRAAHEFAKVWCKANKVDVLRVYGRAGWERAMGLDRFGVISQERF